jgi:molybdopterin molybdotransferase
LVEQSGARAVQYGIVPDEPGRLQSSLQLALKECEAVLLSGGSSVGAKDVSLEAIERMDRAEVLAHGVALSPGKPTILASIQGKPLIGLPGQVTSAQVVMHVLVLPFLRHLCGCEQPFDRSWWHSRPARLTRNVSSKPGREDYIRVQLERSPDGFYAATPLLGMSGLLRTMLGAQGLVRIPANLEGLKRDAPVEAYLI